MMNVRLRTDRILANVWTNGTTDGQWGTAGNWSRGHVPERGETVLFTSNADIPGASTASCTAAAGTVAAYLQSIEVRSYYSGTIIFNTNFSTDNDQLLFLTGNFIVNGGTFIVTGRQDDSTTGVGVTINAANAEIGSGAILHSDYRGFSGGAGPGAGGNGLGATHGGRGSHNRAAYYGDPTAPVTLGSGGGTITNLKGGGAIKITAAGTITVDGTIRANGRGSGSNYGGGSGGSVWLDCAVLTGSGLIQANGGSTGSNGGGGGRIAVTCTVLNYNGEYDCAGGTGGVTGAPGTLSLPSGSNLTVTRKVGLAPGSHVLGTVVVNSGGVLTFHGAQNGTGASATGSGCALTAAAVTVDGGGLISADREGFMGGDGPGLGAGTGYGASHGGRGGNNHTYYPYGSVTEPITLGSGGGNSTTSFGGGAIKIDVGSGTLTVNGTISANSYLFTLGNYGGAAGGSIWLLCGTMAGSGLVQTNGGSSNNHGGGGGRISASWTSSSFMGSWNCGGGAGGPSGNDRDGAGGTLNVPDGTSLTIDRDVGFAPGTTTLGSVTILNGATVTMQSSQTGGGGSAVGIPCKLVVSSLDLQSGGMIWADEQGFRPLSGPGYGSGVNYGASHGGRGGNNAVHLPYGSATAPTTLGSGATDVIGGGAIKIDAGNGTINVDGIITTAGGTNYNNNGGAAGGSVYLIGGTISGNGQIKAVGGSSNQHGGGGGRIALDYTTSTFTGSTDVSGGLDAGDGSNPGEAGSVAPGNLRAADHTVGQASDAFGSAGSYTDALLYRMKITTDGNTDDKAFEDIKVTRLVFDLTNVVGIAATDISNVRLFTDVNNNGVYDSGTDVAVSGTASISIAAGSGTITIDFGSNLLINDSRMQNGYYDFLLLADVANLVSSDKMTVTLNVADSKIVAVGETLNQTCKTAQAGRGFAELTGSVSSVTHQED